MTKKKKTVGKTDADVILIGAGIMSATLGVLLKQLEPNLSIEIYERLDIAAAESSDAWNNAGTGHSAFCELNYTPEKKDGTVEIKKAVQIAEHFEVSKQFWSYLVNKGLVSDPCNFIRNIPHMSFVWGKKNVEYLKKRYDALTQCDLFSDMQYTEDTELVKNWAPLIMDGRKKSEKVAATKMDLGTDVNFGTLTRDMFNNLKEQSNVNLYFNHEIRDLKKDKDGNWIVKVKDLESGDKRKRVAKFVFIGAGGGSLPLLEKSDIPEGKGFGGFPVSGQWLKCTNEEIIKKHHAKVYGKAAVGAPPMSVPHLDTRMINGKQALLFGPYAGFSTKFLKNGSFLDLPKSIKFNNIRPMLSAGLHNLDLTKYLIEQVRQSPEDRLEALKEYLPTAELKDWELEYAGQRVQVIKKDEKQGGILEFGTEVVSAADGSIAALLGASPGASTAVSIMLDLLNRCFADDLATEEWQAKIKEMIPTYGKDLAQDADLCKETRNRTSKVLKIENAVEA
ncbi:malate:quinone oxidoreductase [Pedobacter psychrodurus]|uniref:Probable malate:quinone oxidoreductase n=1 Tax=Pedobacter psychrodurus TaxID=2530456 RepID=A0A4V2MQ13_9SPHI|nr:malate:quinone oxidoreductase [Pedobacter psychrodurus]TCD22037.1 malate:quinone oxidoreductase [Pedobacter psychrodurus]